MKRLIIFAILGVACAILAVVGYYYWDSSRNRGHDYGYYGQFNTASNAVARIKGVTILKTWYNNNLTLEEFGFEIRLADGHTNRIWFGENIPARKMTGSQLEQALAAAIQNASAANIVEIYP